MTSVREVVAAEPRHVISNEVFSPRSDGRAAPAGVAALGVDVGGLRQDLTLLDRTAQQQAAAKVAGALAGVALPLLLGAASVARRARGARRGAGPAALLGGPLGFRLPDRRVPERAEERRTSFRHARSSYLDLVTVLLAGGGHIETALVQAARVGDGWSRLRCSLRRCSPCSC